MNAALQTFTFEGKTDIRTIMREESPWFVGKDACTILGLKNITEALRSLEDDERGSEILNTLGGPQEFMLVSESGLYALIFKSRKPEAKRFRKWVTSEVLPSLRKTGAYQMPAAVDPTPIQGTRARAESSRYNPCRCLSEKGPESQLDTAELALATALHCLEIYRQSLHQPMRHAGVRSVGRSI